MTDAELRQRAREFRETKPRCESVGCLQDLHDHEDQLLTALLIAVRDEAGRGATRPIVQQIDCPRCGYQQGLS